MLDQQNEIELLKKEVAQLRGGLEVANHALETAEQRQKDLYADTDARIRSLEGSGTAETGVDQTAPVIDTEDAKAYKEAYAFSQEAKHKEAFAAFDHFLKTYPDSTLIPDALYGLGFSQFAL
jgi:TolA-binding protein